MDLLILKSQDTLKSNQIKHTYVNRREPHALLHLNHISISITINIEVKRKNMTRTGSKSAYGI